MRLAFSTLGCPGWTFNEIFASAKDFRFDGIEIRGIESQMVAPKLPIFSEKNLAATNAKMKEAGLVFSMLTSAATLGTGDIEPNMAEAKDYINLAKKAGVGNVRVLAAPSAPPSEKINITRVKTLYKELCEYAKGSDVNVLLETSGQVADSAVMLDIMQSADSENAGVVWDIHHPFRYFHEPANETVAKLGKYIKYVQVKDSAMVNGKLEYRMMGYGDVPVFDAMKSLKNAGFDGFVSYEWVKRWSPDLEEPGIVFYHYANYMRTLFTLI